MLLGQTTVCTPTAATAVDSLSFPVSKVTSSTLGLASSSSNLIMRAEFESSERVPQNSMIFLSYQKEDGSHLRHTLSVAVTATSQMA